MKNAASRLPPGNAISRLAKVVLFGGAAVYGVGNSIFNVEGGHRWAIRGCSGRGRSLGVSLGGPTHRHGMQRRVRLTRPRPLPPRAEPWCSTG